MKSLIHMRPQSHETLSDSCKTAAEPCLYFKKLSCESDLHPPPDLIPGNIFFPLPSPPFSAAPDLLQRLPSSLLFPVLSQKRPFSLTFKAGIANALADSRQGGRHLNDLISSHIGLV